jgi:PAS domain S-box-containing protein
VKTASIDTDLMSLAEYSPAMLWRGDINGRCVYLNANMRAFWGLKPEDCGTFDWSGSLLADDHEAVFGPFSAGMSSQTGFECEGRYRRADGEIRILRTRASPYRDARDVFAGMIGVNEDITELRRAEMDLAETVAVLKITTEKQQAVAERLSLATSILGLAMSEHDASLRYAWSHNVPGDPIGKTPTEAFGANIGAALEPLLRDGLIEDQSREMRLDLDGQQIWLSVATTPVRRLDGQSCVLASALDITARKLDEEKLGILARELSHRVKNVFALVQAIVRQTARTSHASGDFVRTLDERLIALARAQDVLLAGHGDAAPLRELLEAQVAHLTGVDLSGPAVMIPHRLVSYICLAIHELGTNSIKYGSLSVPEGRVALCWSITDDHQVLIDWREQNGPANKCRNGASGFGTQLLTRLFTAATRGEANIAFEDGGLIWRARVPLSDG